MAKVTVADTAGFCFGVDRAIKLAYEAADRYRSVLTLGPIIHNPDVVKDLELKGARVIDSLDGVSESDTVIIRSHGVGPEVYEKLMELGCRVIDATCPYVKKIHEIVKERSELGEIILIAGDPNHPEVKGIVGYAKNECYVFSDTDELMKLIRKIYENIKKPIAILSQTTYNISKWEDCKRMAEGLSGVTVYNTVCAATSRRQSEARKLSLENDVMIIVGGCNSSNTRKLYDICSENAKCYLIENAEDLKNIDFTHVRSAGISAGASTPAYIIKEVQKTMTEILTKEEEFNFEEAIEQTFKKIYTGKRVSGVVTAVNPTEVIVDIGTKQTGYIPQSEISSDPSAKPSDIVKVGDEIDVIVTKINDVEGIVYLSKKQVDALKGYDEVKEAAETGATVTGVVTNVIKGGVIVAVSGMRVFVPASQTGVRADASLEGLLKKTVNLKIIELNEQRKRAVGSIRKVAAEERAAKRAAFFETAEVGQTVTGEVRSITDYGVFVDVGGVDGLVRKADLTWARIKHPSEVVSVGDHIEVTIKDIDKETGKVSLVYKKQSDNPWDILRNNYELGQVVEAKIVSITSFGAFAQIIPGIDGLIHISQIADQRVNNVADFLNVGDVVKAKITECDFEKKRVSLSIRALLGTNAETEEVNEAAKVDDETVETAEKAEAEEASDTAGDVKVDEAVETADTAETVEAAGTADTTDTAETSEETVE